MKAGPEKRSKLLKLSVIPFTIALWAVLTLHEGSVLQKFESKSLFLYDWNFLASVLHRPGGFLSYIGSFCMQFMHLPWLGALLWTALLMLTADLTKKAFKIPAGLAALAYIPAFILLAADMSLGYAAFTMKDHEFFFSPLLGYIFTISTVMVLQKDRGTVTNIILPLVWAVGGYALFGTYAVAGVLAAGLAALTDKERPIPSRLVSAVWAIVLTVGIPLLLYCFYTTFRTEDSWIMGLPRNGAPECQSLIRIPYIILLVYLLAVSLLARKLQTPNLKSATRIGFQAAVTILGIGLTWAFWFTDVNFHAEQAMSNAVDECDWQKVVDIHKATADRHAKSDERNYEKRQAELRGVRSQGGYEEIISQYAEGFYQPSRGMVMYKDLALLEMNRAFDMAFTLKDGSRLQDRDFQLPLAYQEGIQLYLYYGFPNYVHRWCLEEVIEYGWSYSTCRYMILSGMVQEEWNQADKYLRMMEHTLFYRNWARSMRGLMYDADATLKAEPFRSIKAMICQEDEMSNDAGLTETFLIERFSKPRPANATPEYDRAALLWAMRMQDIQMFWRCLYYYTQSNDLTKVPRHIQEAALLYSTLEKETAVQLPYEKTIADQFAAFNQAASSGNFRSEAEASYPLSRKFGKTFFHYYYFMRGLKTY